MKRYYFTFILLCFMASSCTMGNLSYQEAMDRNNKKLETEAEREDANFLVEAADYNILLMQLAEKAANESYARLVSEFATKALNEHKIMGERIEDLAKEEDITVPSELDSRHQDMIQDLEQADKTNFDRVYLSTLEILHERLMRLYEDAALNANDAEIRAYAAAQLDIIRSHNKRAREIRNELI